MFSTPIKVLVFSACVSLLVALSPANAATESTLLVYGDSLSAGYGIGTQQSWPALLGPRLKETGSPLTVANASISGETTAGGRARFDAVLAQFKPAVVILALGANDGLRGLPVTEMKNNLSAMIAAARKSGAKVLLVGIRLPPNYGPTYTKSFEGGFRELSKAHKVTLLPFLLEPIAADRSAFQADGLHPTATVQPKILDHVWRALKPLLKDTRP